MPSSQSDRFRIALVRHHDLCLNSRQIAAVQKRAGVLPHLGLGYIETVLRRDGFDTVQFDSPAMGLDGEGLKQALIRYQPHLVCVSTTTPGLPGAIEACEAARASGAKVILGGPHTEVFGAENLHHDCIDYVGVGEGLTIVPQLAAALASGGETKDIRGLICREHHGGVAPMINLADVGWPRREGLPMNQYFSIMAKRPFATMISSRGCPFKCSFCFKQIVDKKSMYRTAEDVVDEMEYLVHRWGVREIMFYDDVFTMHRKRVAQICELIRKRNLKVRWEAPTRVDLVPNELLKDMAAAGCVRLRFGIEHGDPEILESMGKESSIEKIERAVIDASNVGISAFGYFIVGWLNETQAQFERTVELAQRLPFDYASFYTATPLPGTRLFRESVEAGVVPQDFWLRFVKGEFDLRMPELAPNAHQRAQEAYRRFYFRPQMMMPITRHIFHTGQFSNTLSGLLTLARSSSNTVRDF
ncbi:B12-binding domain-containing radical SAM protein [Shimia ponticola]|uniref:B12-binding domain-containing radical SAM protein n=1 Tax=Shimia ponticola TaxID=2582893 RepID=UPI001C9B5CA8|nr:radical SAM protein [Shimia ponticola]